MSKTFQLRWSPVCVSLLLVSLGWGLWSVLAPRPAAAQTFAGVQGDRTRIALGFQVKPEAVQQLLPAPWQLDPVGRGPLKGTNFFVLFIDRVRDEDPEGKPKYSGANRYVTFLAPGKHPQTGQTAAVALGGLASNLTQAPDFFQVLRAATVRAEHTSAGHEVDTEDVMDIWEAREVTGPGEVVLRLRSLRQVSARTRTKGDGLGISAKDPTLWQTYKSEAATDVVQSVPEGINRVQEYTFRLTVPEYSPLFDGSEQLLGISMAAWYVRQVFVQ
jgi:hypothetical protein